MFVRSTKSVGLARGPLLFVLVWAWPMEGLSPEAHLLAAVFAWTVTYWVTEALPVPVTAVFSSVLSIVLGVAPAETGPPPPRRPHPFFFFWGRPFRARGGGG